MRLNGPIAPNETDQHYRKDPEHPQEDADTTSKNKCESSALPRAKGHQGPMEPDSEVVAELKAVELVAV